MKSFLAAVSLLVFCSLALPVHAEKRIIDDVVWYRIHLSAGIGKNTLSPDVIRQFIKKEVSPRFSDGLTISTSHGQWKSPDVGMVYEKTTKIDIQCLDTPENSAKVAEIGEAYTTRFKKAKTAMYVLRISGIQATIWQ